MPEGPSIVILREAVEALHLEGQRIVRVSGNSSKIDKEALAGREVLAFKSWGKHFLICFQDATLRIHLMLFGTYRINEAKETPARLTLKFKGAELNFYACSIAFFDQPADALYDWTADVMSPSWDPKAAFVKLRRQPDMLVCDALLTQDIFAGSGNIIKNEVLYRLRVHPLSRIGKLPQPKLKALIKETRVYSFQFLEWKKAFTLRQHWLAHTKSVCMRCNLPFTKAKLGKMNRRSFYCENCQRLYV